MKARKLVTEAMLCGLALILSYVESLFPLAVSIPGIKMGLPNLVIVFALYRMGAGSALRISLVRVVLVALLFGNIYSFLYSAAGALLSLGLMTLLKKAGILHTAGVSVAGAVMHNTAPSPISSFSEDKTEKFFNAFFPGSALIFISTGYIFPFSIIRRSISFPLLSR